MFKVAISISELVLSRYVNHHVFFCYFQKVVKFFFMLVFCSVGRAGGGVLLELYGNRPV